MSLQIRYLLLGYAIILFLSSCASQSSQKEKERLIVKPVFTNGLPDPLDGWVPDYRDDFFYVYNYSESDYNSFEKMLDTLYIDTSYWSHSYHFIRYEERYDLPDTMAFKDPNHTIAGMELGSGKYNDYFILIFIYYKGFLSKADKVREEKLIPDNYRIATYEGSKRKERYFVKDSTYGHLIEVDRSVVSIPDSGIR